MSRLAVAVRPAGPILAALGRLPRPAHPGVTWSRPEQWIVKLRPLGHVAPELVAALVEALADELAAAEPAACAIGPATERLAGQWLGLPVTGLDPLVSAVFAATVGIVPVTHPRRWRTHLVLARGRVPAALAGEPCTGSWTARAVVLVADRSAPGRPRLTDLAQVRLGPG